MLQLMDSIYGVCQILNLQVQMTQQIYNLNLKGMSRLELDDQISLMHSIRVSSTRFCRNLYWDSSEDSHFALENVSASLEFLSIRSHSSDSEEMIDSQKEGQSMQMNSTVNSSSNTPSLGLDLIIIEGSQQNLYRMEEEGLHGLHARTTKEQKYNQYCLGHIDYLTSCPWSLYGSSRKYQRSKKGKGNKKLTQLEAIAKRMKSLKGKRLDTGYPKRFDQELNKIFRKLKTEIQDQYDITPEALRNIIKHLKVGDNSETFDRFIKKCESEKHWSVFLKTCLRQKRINCEEDLNK